MPNRIERSERRGTRAGRIERSERRGTRAGRIERSERRHDRAGASLLVLTVLALFVGAWAQLAPASFHTSFPFGQGWLAADGPYNEHLLRDVGGLNLALALVTASRPGAPAPSDLAGTADSIGLAFLVVLETLSPLERVAFLLHDVFGYRHDEVAAMLDRSPAAARQLVSRARRHLADRRPRYEEDRARQEAVTAAFVAAVDGADLEALVGLLAPDVVFVADGGGAVPATRHPQHGAGRVARLILSLRRQVTELGVVARELNRQPALVVTRPAGAADSAWFLQVREDWVAAIHVVRNPGKLGAVDTARGEGASGPPHRLTSSGYSRAKAGSSGTIRPSIHASAVCAAGRTGRRSSS